VGNPLELIGFATNSECVSLKQNLVKTFDFIFKLPKYITIAFNYKNGESE
jgi:hypothetical protein